MIIEFAQDLQPMSGILYWFVVINAFACLAFTLVVIVGGIHDLKFLLSALQAEEIDDLDDGRVIKTDVSAQPDGPAPGDS
ncbi:hypothetical protein OAS39_13665 [Pirellulales bacterium]|nr:hypothetical protein [Pirellulales bacterium]